MMNKMAVASAAALILAGGSTAHAEPKLSGTFTRTYDRAHLAAHPDQIIRAVRLSIIPPNADHPKVHWLS